MALRCKPSAKEGEVLNFPRRWAPVVGGRGA